jgi:hypothetical protein
VRSTRDAVAARRALGDAVTARRALVAQPLFSRSEKTLLRPFLFIFIYIILYIRQYDDNDNDNDKDKDKVVFEHDCKK